MTDRLDVDAAKERLKSLEAEIERVRAVLPQDHKTRPTPPMRCPKCGDEMEPGNAIVKETIWGFIFAGISYQHLFFRGDEAEKDECLMNPGVPHRAFRCTKCQTVIIRT